MKQRWQPNTLICVYLLLFLLAFICSSQAQSSTASDSSSSSVSSSSVASSSSSSTGSVISSSSSTGGASDLQCISAGLTSDDFCASIVTWLIPSTLNGTIQDARAYYGANIVGACPYYKARSWQCRKNFPRCVPSNVTGAPTIHKICSSSCMYAKRWDHGTCSRYADEYFSDECAEVDYYSSDVSLCDQAGLSDSDSASYWKWILVGILGVIVVALLASYIRVKCRERMTMEDLDREEEARQRARRAKQADKYQDLTSAGTPDLDRPVYNDPDDADRRQAHARNMEMNARANRMRGSINNNTNATIAAPPVTSSVPPARASTTSFGVTPAENLEPTDVSINFS